MPPILRRRAAYSSGLIFPLRAMVVFAPASRSASRLDRTSLKSKAFKVWLMKLCLGADPASWGSGWTLRKETRCHLPIPLEGATVFFWPAFEGATVFFWPALGGASAAFFPPKSATILRNAANQGMCLIAILVDNATQSDLIGMDVVSTRLVMATEEGNAHVTSRRSNGNRLASHPSSPPHNFDLNTSISKYLHFCVTNLVIWIATVEAFADS